ncbi:aldehyde dehydrogenase family protein [Subtercola endophyticus]|uniref:aldehyde dehydrogenase family protein n=1 Tax=Subtercola endophyticus TaxID=2895559 RepID=UPI001E51763A|nr:aldehyde dehydrogenase family protein [Subtercola endophyticus]UFS60122.1 aldehyde dehydrogenase family protein [Subtercola endophyticus]
MSIDASPVAPETHRSAVADAALRDIPGVVTQLRATFDAGLTKPYAWRIRQLKALKALLLENTPAIEGALLADLAKNPAEAQLTEIGFVLAEIEHTISNLKSWLRPKRVPSPLLIAPASAKTVREPLGVVLVIAPWNYPVQLLLVPIVGALAAGNAVLAKPSELAPATSAVFAHLFEQYFDSRAVTIVEGGVPETTELLKQRFDHIFYTGNGRVGRIVMQAAVENLTPITLELGGKSPVYVDDTVDLRVVAHRVAWGKFMNAGQTCVAPDYLLTTPAIAAKLEPLLVEVIAEFYGSNPAQSDSYGRIVNDGQFERLTGLLAGEDVVTGGDSDARTRYLAPTVLRGVSRDAPVMAQEIFGPILPIVTVNSLDDAIAHINAGDKPLALYVFSDSKAVRRRFITGTSSGALAFGVPAAHLLVQGLPFGGVGASGMGAYHGERSVAVFSHDKAVLSKSLKPDTFNLVYPPFTHKKDAFIRGFLRKLT